MKALLIIFGLYAALFSGCSKSEKSEVRKVEPEMLPTVAEVADTYKSLNKITREPAVVSPKIAMSCISVFPTKAEIEIAEIVHGPHANAWIDIYMNNLAKVAFQEQAKSYPVGSVIVKEKLMSSYYDSSTKITTKESGGVGGMIKRYPGFNTLSGDWEYFYFEDKSKIVCGKIASCVNCHDSAIDDCVFGTWKNAPKRPETTFPDR